MPAKLPFAGGQWTTVKSSWVQAIKYRPEEQELHVKFKDGAICIYSNIDRDFAWDMFYAGSKGKFIWKMLYYMPYRLG